MQDDKRRFTRVPFDCQVALENDKGETAEGRLVDVSVKGMQIQLESNEHLTSPVRFRAVLGANEPLFTIEGEAEITRETEDGQIGLYLLAVDIDSLTHLRRLVELNLGDSEQVADEITQW
ncbi:MAG: PilZ domain-containing protein [Candidatus Omnitrophica bacterium]|nr:PilZ domain-containing protein [Candidatus Omnitrophota bacterium]MCA9442322.1 PilZ domain-containing protein [Candidatus Omnitrophota bacterium]